MPDPEQLGPYKIERLLGRGGMGAVYVGVHRKTGDRAAVKVLIPQLADIGGFRDRFSAEIDTLKRLDHPNIVRLFGYGEDNGSLFYAMELVNGSSLEEELQQGRKFTWRETAEFAANLAKALKHAHDHGIIHRDIKPANLLLSKEGVLKLTDFGIARLFGNTGLTSAGSLLGTAEYMPPEQAEGRPVTPACDLYSLGGVLYALLAGRPPFRGKTLPEMLHMQRFSAPEPLDRVAPDVPREFQRIVMRLLEKEPEKRYPDATVLIRQLTAMLENFELNPPEERAKDADPSGSATATQAAADVTNVPPENVAGNDPTRMGPEPPATGGPNRTKEADRVTGFERSHSPHQPTLVAPSSGPRFTTVAEDARREAERKRLAESPWRSWQTYVMLAGLLLLIFAAYWFTRPPSADQLYARIQQRAEEAGPLGLSYIEDDLERFIERFPDDPRCKQILSYIAELEVATAERKLTVRTARGSTAADLSPPEREYLAALETSRRSPEQGLLRFQALQALCEDAAPNATAKMVLDLCRQRIAKLRSDIERTAEEQGPWLDARLKKADALKSSDPAAARAIWNAIIELYGDRPWAASKVERARSVER